MAFRNSGIKSLVETWCLLHVLLVSVYWCGSVNASDAAHLRLADNLDRPADGYCIDIHGTPGNLRTDLPLFAHNCKPRLTVDSAVVFKPNGSIEFTEIGLCVTVAGVNSNALPGAAVLLRKCGESSAFFETTLLQQFVLRGDGRVELKQSGLCLAVGPRSGGTYSSSDRWRPLFVVECAGVDASLSRWQFVQP